MSEDLEDILQRWLAENVHNVPGLSEADQFEAEVARLRARIAADLPDRIGEIEATFELDDLIGSQLEAVLDPELGFKDFD